MPDARSASGWNGVGLKIPHVHEQKMSNDTYLQDGAGIERAFAEVGPLLPVREAAALRGCSCKAVRDRIRRGSIRRFVVLGHHFVALKEVCSPSLLGK